MDGSAKLFPIESDLSITGRLVTLVRPIDRALSIAVTAHNRQEYGKGLPYIHHVLDVVNRVNETEDTNPQYVEDRHIVALLHDVVEDTDLTLQDLIEEGFNQDVVSAVAMLTRGRHEDYFRYIGQIIQAVFEDSYAGRIAREVKIADLESNLAAGDKNLEKYNLALFLLEEMEDYV